MPGDLFIHVLSRYYAAETISLSKDVSETTRAGPEA